MDAANRLKIILSDLTKFYERRFHECALFDPDEVDADFDNSKGRMDSAEIDAYYIKYIEKLSEGVDEVLAKHNVRLDPVPPGSQAASSCETLAGGVGFLGWKVQVFDATNNMPVGIIHWGLYHRHDSFAVPGPAQVAFVKAAPGKTIMVG